MNMPLKTTHSPAAQALLLSAEALIAEQGIDAVSSRELARRAGQKNHSAVNYHFGSFEGLVEALIDLRAMPINEQRERALARLLERTSRPEVSELVALMIRPLAAQLLESDGDSHYLSLLTQLLTRDRWRQTFMRNRQRSPALQQAGALLSAQLGEQLPASVLEERLHLLGRHIIHTVAEWETGLRAGEIAPATLAWRIDDFIAYSVAGLQAPTHSRTD